MAGVLYTVFASDPSGRRYNCSATSDSGCELSTLECGTEYNVTITPSRDGCVGVDSPYQLVRTGRDQMMLYTIYNFNHLAADALNT